MDLSSRVRWTLYSLSSLHLHLLHSFFHLLLRHIFLVRSDTPEMAKRILNEAGAISIELVLNRFQGFGSLGHGLFDDLVTISDVHIQAYGRAAHAGCADVALAHAGIFIRQHDARVANL